MDQQNSWQTCRRKGRLSEKEEAWMGLKIEDEMERISEKLEETEVDVVEKKNVACLTLNRLLK